jgi:hypothetical protein
MTEPRLAQAFDRLVPAPAYEPDWDDVIERATTAIPLRRNRRLWYALAAAAVLLGILVSPAFGLGERLVDLFTGSPVPKPVKRELSFGTNVSNSKVDELMRQEVSSVVLTAQARGLFEVSTAAGVLRIWGAPTSDGGFCTYMRFVGAANGSLRCDTPKHNAGPLFGGADELKQRGKTIVYVSGQAREEIASIELGLADGSTQPVRMVRPYFFRVLQPGEEPEALVGRNSSGGVVATIPARFESFDPNLVLPPVSPVGPSHEVFVVETTIGSITMAAAPGPDGKRCWTVKAESSELIACRAVPRGFEFAYGPFYNVEQTRSVVFLSGFVGPQVHKLELEFEDGDSVALDLLEDYFLYEVPRSHWSAGHRPTVLVARDRDGHVLSRRRVE